MWPARADAFGRAEHERARAGRPDWELMLCCDTVPNPEAFALGEHDWHAVASDASRPGRVEARWAAQVDSALAVTFTSAPLCNRATRLPRSSRRKGASARGQLGRSTGWPKGVSAVGSRSVSPQRRCYPARGQSDRFTR